MSIQSRIDQVATYAEREFKDFIVHVMRNDEDYRHYYCKHPQSGFSSFEVMEFGSHLVITGDLGDFIFTRCEKMLDWARDSIDSVGYFSSKLVAGSYREDFCKEVAVEWIEEQRNILNGELIDANEIEDLNEVGEIDKRLSILVDLEDYLRYGDIHSFQECVYEEWAEYDVEILDEFWNYTYSFLWCRQGLKFLLNHLYGKNNVN